MRMHHMPVFKMPRGFLAKPRLDESDSPDPVAEWFRGFKTEYRKVRDGWGTAAELLDMSIHDCRRLRRLFYDMFPDEVRERLRFVGAGTTRIAFVSDRNVCYKFEFNDHCSQSLNEIRDARLWGHLACFPKLFDFSDDGAAMAYEAAEKPTENDFRCLFGGADSAWVGRELEAYGKGEENRIELLAGSGALSPPQEKVLRDLMLFQKSAFEERGRCLSDINHADNWGRLYREGMPVLIVTDFGL